MKEYDAIVLGVGGMGSATLYHLARRGLKAIGIERYDIPNDMGSSHGVTRVIRLAYYEDPSYVPLLRRAYQLWRQLENGFGERLLVITGSIDASPEDSDVFQGSRTCCELHHLPHEVMTGEEVNSRFPGYNLPRDLAAVHQPDGGFLLPERCIVAHVTAALDLGAEVHGREQALSWEPLEKGVKVRTDRDEYVAGKLVISAGAWAANLVPGLSQFLVPERQVLAWFQPARSELFKPGVFPVFNVMVDDAGSTDSRPTGYPASKWAATTTCPRRWTRRPWTGTFTRRMRIYCGPSPVAISPTQRGLPCP